MPAPKPAAISKPRQRAADGSFAAHGTIDAKALRKIWTSPVTTPRIMPTPSLPNQLSRRESVVSFSAMASESVDKINAVIHGVSVITSGVIARGHNLEVDDTTISQIKNCAEEKVQVPVKVDHQSGAAAVCGFLTNFRTDGNKLKADWHLLKTHSLKDTILEVAERMPKGVGLSASFLPPTKAEKAKSGVNAARCEELISVDYVTLPAANPNGMFSAQVDTTSNTKSTMTPEDLKAINDAIAAQLAPISERLDSIEANSQEKQDGDDAPLTPEELTALNDKSDDELAALGISRAEVDAAVADFNASVQADEDEAAAGEGQDNGEEGAEVGAAAGGAELSAVLRTLQGFAAELRQAKAHKALAEREELIAGIETRFDALLEQNIHLQAQLEMGGRPASHGGLTGFKSKSGTVVNFGTKEPGRFEQLVIDHLDANPKATQGQAFGAVIRANGADYADYLSRRGLVRG